MAKTTGRREHRNLYDYVSAAEVAKRLERTQINKFHTKGGTGFAAEDANALNDRLRGHKVDATGVDNAFNGADRTVNGIQVQTKYFDTAGKTLNAAFSDGSYRYPGQLLEVPSDQYEDCLALMRAKIKAGQVAGITDPAAAIDLVKKGDYTYRQARNIARAGNLDSLRFDAKTQAVTSSYAFAISFSISFARSCWEGRDVKLALKDAAATAFQSGVTSFLSGIVTAQILRTKAAAMGTVVMRNGMKSVARTQLGKKAIQKIAEVSLGKAVHGAAAVNHVAKLVRSNAITGAVTTVVISAPDFYRVAFSGSISWTQFGKNLTVNAAGVAGGAGGWMAGAAAGATAGSVVPGVGTAAGGFIGAIIGGLLGGSAASAGSKYLLDGLIEDDAKRMLDQLPGCLEPLCIQYLLSSGETDVLVAVVQKHVNTAFLRRMYQSHDRTAFIQSEFQDDCERIIRARAPVAAPPEKHVQQLLADVRHHVATQAPASKPTRSASPRKVRAGPSGAVAAVA